MTSRKEYEKVELTGDLSYRLFITNTKIFQDKQTFFDCKNWLEEHIGEIWIDWAWPTAHIADPEDSEQWIMMLFRNEKDALRFKMIWG